ncbi:hypothetical protein C442_06051 [Haloarcula amylolytica JCM 13557]|uniref:Transposase zinc-ribbon domain-containing protein n=1 Tax=Haloarcula amylolytica JCM 13557 TaxID=1227452 RepID=M0KQL9_9EURY|nr:hypothetical protein C442_06051 [Haloarcula amylolytica JCM 13557]
MSSAQPAFGATFRELIELGVVDIDTEPLDARIERRLKEFWENTSCPRCGHNSVQTWPHLDRVWCRDCNFRPVYTYGTPFHEKHLTCGEVFLAFTLYADTLLSINQIAPFLIGPTKPFTRRFRRWKPRFSAASPPSGDSSTRLSMDRYKWTNLAESARATKAKSRRGTAVLAAAHPRQVDHAGGAATVIS